MRVSVNDPIVTSTSKKNDLQKFTKNNNGSGNSNNGDKKGLKRELGEACKNKVNDEKSIQRLYKKYKSEMGNGGVTTNDMLHSQMMMNIAVTANNYDIATEIFKDITSKTRETLEPIYTLYIKCLCNNDLIEEAFDVIKQMTAQPHLRTLLILFEKKLTTQQFEYLAKFLIELKLNLKLGMSALETIFSFIPNDCNVEYIKYLVTYISDHHHHVSQKLFNSLKHIFNFKELKHPDENILNNDIQDEDRHKMMECLRCEETDELIKFIQDTSNSHSNSIIIDGSNVAMYNSSEFNFNKILLLLSQINRESNIIIVFHIGRKKQIQKYFTKNPNLKLPKGVAMWYSKRKQDDDLSWLFACLYLNAKCITCDKLRNHIYYKFTTVVPHHTIEKWMEKHVIPFEFKKERRNFHYRAFIKWPPKIIPRTTLIQNDNENAIVVYIPVEDKWYTGTLNVTSL